MIRQSFFGRMTGIGLVSLFVLAGSAAADARTRIYVAVGPPAPIAQVRIAAPGPGYVWVPGYYRYYRRSYAWVPGAWVVPPRPRAVWVSPRWHHHARRGWYVAGGYWR